MALKHTGGADDFYGEEIDKLRQSFMRVSFVALTLLYFALTVFTAAMSSVDGEELATELSLLEGVDIEGLEASYVFSRHVEEMRNSPGEEVEDGQLVKRTERTLDELAKKWLSLKFEFLGTSITADLRYMAPFLPFIVMP